VVGFDCCRVLVCGLGWYICGRIGRPTESSRDFRGDTAWDKTLKPEL
jgi:hypothetical protein